VPNLLYLPVAMRTIARFHDICISFCHYKALKLLAAILHSHSQLVHVWTIQ